MVLQLCVKRRIWRNDDPRISSPDVDDVVPLVLFFDSESLFRFVLDGVTCLSSANPAQPSEPRSNHRDRWNGEQELCEIVPLDREAA